MQRCTSESCPAIGGGSGGTGGIQLTFLLTQDTEVQASPVRASRAGGHAEVVAGILHPNRVDLQGAIGQELQPGEGEQVSPARALHGQHYMGTRSREGGEHPAARCGMSPEQAWGQGTALHQGTALSLLQACWAPTGAESSTT